MTEYDYWKLACPEDENTYEYNEEDEEACPDCGMTGGCECDAEYERSIECK